MKDKSDKSDWYIFFFIVILYVLYLYSCYKSVKKIFLKIDSKTVNSVAISKSSKCLRVKLIGEKFKFKISIKCTIDYGYNSASIRHNDTKCITSCRKLHDWSICTMLVNLRDRSIRAVGQFARSVNLCGGKSA